MQEMASDGITLPVSTDSLVEGQKLRESHAVPDPALT